MDFTILGAGTWGITLAELLNFNKHSVSIWHYNPDYISELKAKRFHERLNHNISEEINFLSNTKEINDISYIVICIPSQEIRETLLSLKLKNHYYINASKGIELNSGKLISEIIAETTNAKNTGIACLSGPSHAEEVIKQIPTVISVASKNLKLAQTIQGAFSNDFFRVYQSDSIEAMQVGGAVKNIISIAAGISNGLGYGDNTIAALITRGIQEIISFSHIYTFDSQSLLGISGIGDLIATATSKHSRNKYFGECIGRGRSSTEILNEMEMVVEGVQTAKAVYLISKDNNISMPICHEVYNILFNKKDPSCAIHGLMSRKLRSE